MSRELLILVVIQLTVVHIVTNAYFIEVLESRNFTSEEVTSLRDAVNKINFQLKANGSSFELRLTNCSLEKDLYDKDYSLFKSNAIAIFSLDPDPLKECILSSSGMPLFRLHENETTMVNQFGFCDNVLTMSANSLSYAEATVPVLDTFRWRKLALVFEVHRFYQAVYFQALTANKDYDITHVEMTEEVNKNLTTDVVKKVWKTVEKSDVDVILLYVKDSYKAALLNMALCNPKKYYVWIIQESVKSHMISYPSHMVIGFRLPRDNNSFLWKDPTLIEDDVNLILDATSVVSASIDKLMQAGAWLSGSNTSSMVLNRRKLYEQAVKEIRYSRHRLLHKQRSSKQHKGVSDVFKTNIHGRTGSIKFASNVMVGKRLLEQLSIANLRNGVFVEIGTWFRNSSRLRLTGEIKENIEHKTNSGTLQGKKLSITTMVIEPFVIKTKLPDGSIHYSGFCIDVLQKLASEMKFTYDIHESLDLEYGSVKNGSWNGMIRELMDGKADMIVADITITGERERVVDFTASYMYYREDMVMRKTPIEFIDFLQFLSPFSTNVWLMLMGGVMLVSLALFVLNYFSPYGNKNDQGTKTSDEFHILNCFWFSIACMLQQGADHIPKAISGRILVSFFWFTILIWVSTYTANLAAFFTVHNFVFPITNFEEAVESTQYEMGVSKKSHLYSFFSTSQVELYKRAWDRMKEFPKDNVIGIQWARERQYIHIANGPLLEYDVRKAPCNLIQIPGLSTPKSYGFALKNNDPHVDQLSLGILHLRGNGFIEGLKLKYWRGNGKCNTEVKKKITRSTIQLSSVAGLFVVLAVGCLISVLILILETCWYHNIAGIREKFGAQCERRKKQFVIKRNDLHMGNINPGVEEIEN